MPSTRRVRVITLLVIIIVIVTLYITSGARQTRESAFYQKTQDALAQQRAAKEASLGSREGSAALDAAADTVGKRLRDAEDAAKKAADKKAEKFHGGDVVEDKKKEREALNKQAAMKVDGDGKKTAAEIEEDHEVKDELNSILKRSPIIIFSKTYCPFSKKAKAILLTKYKITPQPYVVELDEHKIGPRLQAELKDITGRGTVPNVLVNGKSIGGGDDVEKLHEDGEIISTLKSMLGKRVDVTAVKAKGI